MLSEKYQDTPWVEKYRPNTLSGVKDQAAVTEFFSNSMQKKQIMHLLFYGPPGTGKTSTILAFCHKLYANRVWSDYVLEINASYDRGSQSIKDRIRDFCKKAIEPFYSEDLQANVNYKFVVLDEADSLGKDTQNSLRRYIEMYSHNTRFCFLCNYVNRIFVSIVSRCLQLHFHPIGQETCLEQMKTVCSNEKVQCTDEALTMLYHFHRGDLRSCISSLQAMNYLYHCIDEASFLDFSLFFNINEITMFFSKTDISATDILEFAENLYYRGYSPRHILARYTEWCSQMQSDEVNYLFAEKVSSLERECTVVKSVRLLLFNITMVLANSVLSNKMQP